MIKIAICSDLHLEFYQDNLSECDFISEILQIDDKCDTLVIAGDFAHPYDENDPLKINQVFLNVLTLLKQRFIHIIYVPGNHEYYQIKKHNISIENVDIWIKNICDNIGIHFLQKDSWLHPSGVKFLGCTLWSNIDPIAKKNTKNFKYVFDSCSQYNTLHKDHLIWLEKELIDSSISDPLIVITHYIPSFKGIPPHRSHPVISTAFATNLEYLFNKPMIGWIAGHSHEPMSVKINDIWLYLNPLGYKNERLVNSRKKDPFVFEQP